MSNLQKSVIFGGLCGATAFLVLVIAVVATGPTFGQRCAERGFIDTEFDQCDA